MPIATTRITNASAFAEDSKRLHAGWILSAGSLVLLLWAAWTSQVNFRLLASRQVWMSVGHLIAGFFPPDVSLSFLAVALHATLTTAATALIATIVSVAFAIPLAALACGRLWRAGITTGSRNGAGMAAASWLVLHVLAVVRSVPDLVWALLLVAGVGLGPTAGTVALAIFYTALLGRVYVDIFDQIDVRSLEALQSVGANRLQVFLFGILPQSRALMTSYTLYSFECSVRSAAVLGFVGAGGLGYEISLSMRLFEFSQVFTLIACFILMLLIVDLVSRYVRERILARPEVSWNASTRRTISPSHGRGWMILLILAALFAASLVPAGITPANLLQSDALPNFLRFVRHLLAPELSLPFLREIGGLVLQTVSISIVGTVSGAMLGFLLALPATRLRASRHESLYRSSLRKLSAEGLFWSARMLLNLLRAIPELVWVLLCVVAVGFGPFAGSIALGLHTSGVLGKLFAETMEETAQEQVEAMLALGAGPLQCLLWALLPQAWPMMKRYIIFRWDMNLRAATILGLVGGGGLGQALYNDVQLADYARVSTLIVITLALVISSDWLSQLAARLELQA